MRYIHRYYWEILFYIISSHGKSILIYVLIILMTFSNHSRIPKIKVCSE